jgi:putative glutamine amidotransferase
MKKPIIGITLAYDKVGKIRSGVEYGYIRKEYAREVKNAGGEPLFLDENIDPRVAANLCDGIVISGGQDIEPIFYGEQVSYAAETEPSERTSWESKLIKACDENNVHILGVCYGSQLLNVHYGGTLYQDIVIQGEATVNHGSSQGSAMHDVTFERDFLGFLSGQKVSTASRHHQAVKDIAPGFEIVCQSSDGIVEAIMGKGHFGIQWHSESDGTAPQIYGEFINLCATNNKVNLAKVT